MIRTYARFDSYAYRNAKRDIDPAASTVEEGQWVTINAAGQVAISGGGSGVKSFMVITSKRAGRDQISGKSVQKLTFLDGHFEVETTKYDAAGTYTAPMTPLKVTTGGILTNWVTGTDKPEILEAWAIGAPSTDGYLSIIKA